MFGYSEMLKHYTVSLLSLLLWFILFLSNIFWIYRCDRALH